MQNISDAVLNFDTLPVKKLELFTLPLEEICQGLQTNLQTNFASVSVEVVDCPDLTQEPFNLAAKGINGNVSFLDVGGVPFLIPLVQCDKVYDMKSIPKLIGEKDVLVIGAAAGPYRQVCSNSEMIVNMVLNENGVKVQSSRIAKIAQGQDKTILEMLPKSESTCSLFGNLHCSRGDPGKVIKINCKKRTGSMNFTDAIKAALCTAFPNNVIGLGGVFAIVKGKVTQHLMPDFSKTPIEGGMDGLRQWMKYYEMSAPLSAVGTLVSQNPADFDLTEIHFHSFGKIEGGHYQEDTTPEEIEYLAYFSLGCTLYRVDKP